MSQPISPMLRRAVTDTEAGYVIVPALRLYLYDPAFRPFTVEFNAFEYRGPDGKFHSSTHPLWTERQLFYYLTRPEVLVAEPKSPQSALAVTVGHFWHSFIGACLLDAKIINRVNVYLEDHEVGSCGSEDGDNDDFIYELKTIHPRSIDKMVDLDAYREKFPEYYAQGQDYMRMSGYREHRTVFIVAQYPFEMREIVMPYDAAYATELHDKYARVRQAVADQREPLVCCHPRSKEAKACICRVACPIGRA